MTRTFGWKEKFEEGKRHEAALDHFFEPYYRIAGVSREFERWGVDRIFTAHTDPLISFSVEYKADSRAAESGNVFLEDVSVDTQNTDRARGWLLKTLAEVVVYYVPPEGVAYLMDAFDLKQAFRNWRRTYPAKRSGLNTDGGYRSRGVVVPFEAFVKGARARYDIAAGSHARPSAVSEYERLLAEGVPFYEAARRVQ